MWGRGQRNKVMKYGEGPRRVRCPWAPNVLATPLHVRNVLFHFCQLWAVKCNKKNKFADVKVKSKCPRPIRNKLIEPNECYLNDIVWKYGNLKKKKKKKNCTHHEKVEKLYSIPLYSSICWMYSLELCCRQNFSFSFDLSTSRTVQIEEHPPKCSWGWS